MSRRTEKVEYWLDVAQSDLAAAKTVLDSKHYLYVGFFCHLATEKALKSVIANTDMFPPKNNNLKELAKLGNIFDDLNPNQLELFDFLATLNIEAKYP
jgi:HEPN domain-containing protein